ncbi:MAG: CDP-glucose 4,6-dehydratase [Castellaniella sp.]|uniref:CDP-glucose 4,6-dehydratase n=1 Tax=Castellaniella sp. TaxID=1955812 RepID=UPI0012107082|nr:CDP-glucose 4,6-dehydratase [Castellaniella sp.]TAN26614.1 MAG: CDP-glucose 4,6-dehydratase [Castellaniella sp.]
MGPWQSAMEDVGMTQRLAPAVCAPDPEFWQGRRVLVTGHTGFKGSWLTLWLHRLGASVTGLALPPATVPNLYALARTDDLCESRFIDIRDAQATARLVHDTRPEVVFHLAAQALVRAGYADPISTYATNVMGTTHVLDALRNADGVRVAIMVTTDKVYRNLERPYPYREDDTLGGYDPYSASKAASELVISSYRDAYLSGRGVAVASARAGNVIGGGDWSPDRLIPDAVRCWQEGGQLAVRRPHATRPWQHVLEPVSAYLRLAECLYAEPTLAGAYNFGPPTHEAATVAEVIAQAQQAYGKGSIKWGDGTEGPHEAEWLALETAKARTCLAVRPRWNLHTAVARTMNWYREQRCGANALDLCEADIRAFESVGVPA